MRVVLNTPITPSGIHYTGMDIVTSLVQKLQSLFGSRKGGDMSTSKARQHISFKRFDISIQYLWPVDLVVVRDILFHFEIGRAVSVLRRIGISGCRYALITTFLQTNNMIAARKYRAGRGFSSCMLWESNMQNCASFFVPTLIWGLCATMPSADASWNLQGQPFALPPPLLAVHGDGKRADRVMGLWRCSNLNG